MFLSRVADFNLKQIDRTNIDINQRAEGPGFQNEDLARFRVAKRKRCNFQIHSADGNYS
jgi:hypothetical protein